MIDRHGGRSGWAGFRLGTASTYRSPTQWAMSSGMPGRLPELISAFLTP
jgi:hypothetical protein